MANVNKVFLIGNLTRDPELRYTSTGTAVSDLGLAVNRVYTTKDGDRREETLFIDVVVWNRQAENCCQYLKKGRSVHVEGYLKMDVWDDKTTGEKRSKVKVEADNVQFLGSRRDEGGGGPDGGDDYAPPAREPAPRRAAPGEDSRGPANGSSRSYNAPPPAARRPTPPPSPESDVEDDIPF